jgi:hypothetical protein
VRGWVWGGRWINGGGGVAVEPSVEVRVPIYQGWQGNSSEFSTYRGGVTGGSDAGWRSSGGTTAAASGQWVVDGAGGARHQRTRSRSRAR